MVVNELRDALRRLCRRPGYSLLSVSVLGVGLGLTLFVFSLVYSLILAPLPYPQPDRLVAIGAIRDAVGGAGDTGVGIDSLDGAQYQLLRDSLSGVDLLGAYQESGISLDAGDRATRYEGGNFTASMMPLLGVHPLLGRGFAAADEVPGAPPVVLIGESLWRDAFGCDRSIIGRAVRVDGGWATVIGVLPASFGFPGNSVVWQPLRLRSGEHADLLGVARLKPGETAASVRAALDAQAGALQRVMPAGAMTMRIIAKPLALGLVPEDLRRWVWLMFGACATVLLLACVNVANLQLVQVLTRRRELALRSALGSHPGRLLAGALAESLGLSLGALLIALPMVTLGNRWLVGMYAAQGQSLSSYLHFGLRPAVVAAAVAAAMASTLFVGLLPAWRAARVDLREALRDGGKGSGRFFPRVARMLVVGEIALTVVLLVGAGTFVRALDVLLHATPVGVAHAAQVATAHVALPPAQYVDDPRRIAFFQRAAERLRETAGVCAVTATNTVPGAELGSHEFVGAFGQPKPAAGWPRAQFGIVDPDFLNVFGVKLQEGRFFTRQDDAQHEAVAVIDRKMAERFWPGRDALGQQVVLWPNRPQAKTLRVIGVIQSLQLDGLLNRPRPGLLLPLAQAAGQGPLQGMGLAVRTEGAAAVFLPTFARVLRGIDADAAVYGQSTQAASVVRDRVGMTILTEVFGALGVVALLLAAAGLYGVLAFSVEQRTQEIGIRRAIGAGTGAILRQFGRQLGWQLASGLAIGVLLAVPWSQLLADPNMRTRALDPAVFVTVVALVAAMAVLAATLPLRRALRVDPVIALHHE
ncbi:MAG: ADOP family duplicated permease [Pseudomonadota bacterium]